MALAGVLFWVGQAVLDPRETTLSALVLTVGLLALGRGVVGRHSLTSLVEMLRSRSVNLDDVGEGLAKLPPHYADEVRRLLTSSDRNAQILGVELAARMNPAEFLPELQALLPATDARLRRSLVRLYAAFRPEDLAGRMRSLLDSEEESLRELALELAVAVPALRQQWLDRERLAAQFDGPSPVVRGLACVAVQLVGVRDEALEAACAAVLEQPLGPTPHLAMIQAVRSAADPVLLPLLRRILERAAPTVQDDALDVLADLLDRGAPAEGLEAVAADFLTHPEAPVRAAAAKRLGRIRTASAAVRLGPRLEDTSQSVREQGRRRWPRTPAWPEPAKPIQLFLDNCAGCGRLCRRLPGCVAAAARGVGCLPKRPDVGLFPFAECPPPRLISRGQRLHCQAADGTHPQSG
jgi:hypothetical protein